MADEDRIARIRAAASEHSGRHLLPHRLRDPDGYLAPPPAAEYEACEELVKRGEARWLGIGGPGIEIVRPPAQPAEPEPPLSLDVALRLLAEVHTRDNHQTGWSVLIGAKPDTALVRYGLYTRAWETVRRHLNMQVDPP